MYSASKYTEPGRSRSSPTLAFTNRGAPSARSSTTKRVDEVETGVTPSGPWFSRHFKIDPAEWDFEVGVPVTAPIAPAGRVKNSALPATRVARTNYRGGFEGLGAGWGEFDAWIADRGLRHDGSLWESYATGPESGLEPAGWRTELNRPLAE